MARTVKVMNLELLDKVMCSDINDKSYTFGSF